MNERAPLSRIGFFHFGHELKSDPINALTVQLTELGKHEERCSFDGLLLVLPEAFNTPDGYWGDRRPTQRITRELCCRSLQYKVAFVVGLISCRQKASERVNFACIIEGGWSRILAKKQQCGNPNLYSPSPSEFNRPIVHRNMAIAAVVCMDFAKENKWAGLVSKVNALGATQQLMCVPSWMGEYSPCDLARRWVDHTSKPIVIANGDSRKCSIIHVQGRSPVRADGDEPFFETNQIKIQDLSR